VICEGGGGVPACDGGSKGELDAGTVELGTCRSPEHLEPEKATGVHQGLIHGQVLKHQVRLMLWTQHQHTPFIGDVSLIEARKQTQHVLKQQAPFSESIVAPGCAEHRSVL